MHISIQNKLIIITAIIIIGTLGYYLVFPLFIKKIWSSTHKDVYNVSLNGFVYDKDKKAIADFTLYITNYYYEGGDYDSYMGGEKYDVITDTTGYYSILLEKSCYIQIEVIEENSKNFIIEKYITKPKNDLNINLK